MWFQVLLNARADWEMKNRKLLEREISHPNVDIKVSQPSSKSIMEMNEETKIFCGFSSTIHFQAKQTQYLFKFEIRG